MSLSMKETQSTRGELRWYRSPQTNHHHRFLRRRVRSCSENRAHRLIWFSLQLFLFSSSVTKPLLRSKGISRVQAFGVINSHSQYSLRHQNNNFSSLQLSPKMKDNCESEQRFDGSPPVILLIGSCGLDRLLKVATYPSADAKIRTLSYNEEGGGNSANTASAIGKLVDAKLFSSDPDQRVRVQFLSKVGDDAVGQQLIDELKDSNVETSSDLFCRGVPGSTTAFTTVIVSEAEQTRTCIHTPGTCGELSMDDVLSLSPKQVDGLFQNVVHLHSDSRHTDVSLWMAKEAKERGITVSCDCEKDRMTPSLDELIEVCDILFTNSNHLGVYLERLTLERERATNKESLPKAKVLVVDDTGKEENLSAATLLDVEGLETCVRSLEPCTYFARWQTIPDFLEKQVVVTHGSMGALHFQAVECSKESHHGTSSDESLEPFNTIRITGSNEKNTLRIDHAFSDGSETVTVAYDVQRVGVLKDPTIVDTTGAGDAFIGGYILSSHSDAIRCSLKSDDRDSHAISLALQMGSFVGGTKLGGPGARSALPIGKDVDDLLGTNIGDVEVSLQRILGSFHEVNEL